jgi:hypothetical protein
MFGYESDPMGMLPLDPKGAELEPPPPPPGRVAGGIASVAGSKKHMRTIRVNLLTIEEERDLVGRHRKVIKIKYIMPKIG